MSKELIIPEGTLERIVIDDDGLVHIIASLSCSIDVAIKTISKNFKIKVSKLKSHFFIRDKKITYRIFYSDLKVNSMDDIKMSLEKNKNLVLSIAISN